MFKSVVTLPDAGRQDRDHTELHELKEYLSACLRMGADYSTITVTANGRDFTERLMQEIIHNAFIKKE